MAVQYVKNNNGLLGSLGKIAQIGGFIPGLQWLTPLGMGMSAVDNIMNGSSSGGYETPGFLNTNNGGLFQSLGSLMSENIARTKPEVNTKVLDVMREELAKPYMSDTDLIKSWSPYNTGGYYSWLQ